MQSGLLEGAFVTWKIQATRAEQLLSELFSSASIQQAISISDQHWLMQSTLNEYSLFAWLGSSVIYLASVPSSTCVKPKLNKDLFTVCTSGIDV